MFFSEKADRLEISVYVQPKASRNQVVGLHDRSLKIKVNAPPVDGEANEAVIEFLADILRVPKSSLHLLRGQTSRQKTIEYKGGEISRVKALLNSLILGS